jgi:ABC-2 type transport system permease protein
MHFLNALQYRFNTFIGLIFGNVRLLIVIIFWNLIYGGDTQKIIRGFTLPGVITYLIAADIFGGMIFALRNSGFVYSSMIKSGSLGPELLKPYNLNMSVYFRNLSGCIPGNAPQIALVICVLPFAGKYFIWNFNLLNAVFIFIFLAAGTISAHLLCSTLGYLAFWFEEADAVMWSFLVLFNMLSGFFLPLDFFPEWSIPILELMPTSSWGYIQSKIYIGFYTPVKIFTLLSVQIIWIGALLCLNAAVLQIGVKKYSSVGG